jgi:hypothetical protein
MIYEYALEPEALAFWAANPSDYRFAFDKFGLGQPRLVSKYPKNWIKQVHDAATSLKDEKLEIKRLDGLIELIREKMIRRQNYNYYGDAPWLENAVREHNRSPFHAILACTNPNGYRDILLISELVLLPDDRWDKQRDMFVPRTAEAMSQAVAPMLRICREAIFIDPHFSPVAARQRYIKSFKAFFSVMKRSGKLFRIEIQADSKNNNFQEDCMEKMPRVIPRNLKVRFLQLQERPNGPELHDRYILTDIGGLELSRGLDEGNGEVRITLLNRESYIKLWNYYCSENPAFDYVSDFRIEGTATLAD